MKYSCVGVPSVGKAGTYHENKEKENQCPDLTFLSKGQLKKMIELLYLEKSKPKEEINVDPGSLAFNEENFKRLMQTNLILERQAYENEVKMNEQKREIITLYDRIHQDKNFSAIMIAG